VPVVVTVLALVAVLLPLAGSAEAKRKPAHHRPGHHAARAHAVPAVVGQPRRNYVIPPSSYFSFPNRSKMERLAIRNRVLYTIQSTWGGARNSLGGPLPANGKIRIATWSFDDWAIAKALVAARKRGVSVQVVAAKSANRGIASWRWLRKKLGSRLYRRGYPITREMHSFARQCRGACRGPGGTPHAKYFLFDNVGASHTRNVVVQTSANLTEMAFQGQWNQAQVMHSSRAYTDFYAVFRQAAFGRPLAQPYHVAAMGSVVNYFFPRPKATPAQDPVMQNLDAVNCRGATAGSGNGRTTIRIIQYAIYGERGVWIAKKLRSLWEAGCDIAIIYSVSSRPVLTILRKRSGRGAVPMRQSVVKDPWGNIVKYNHSKWMTITGHWAVSTADYMTFSGSANWANLAFGGDEQMQRILSRAVVLRHLAAFAKTWRQRTSSPPTSGRVMAFGRTPGVSTEDVPEDLPEEPVFGQGIYRYLPED
jgi:phosphatidylserine/phosphatidylglycerophosphate/cardiolipin synthase-like enzyme